MITRYTHRKVQWIDLESPSREEVRDIMDEFRLHPVIAEELLTPSARPRIEIFPDNIYAIMHFPAISHSHGTRNSYEVDYIIGPDYLITTHYELIDPLHEFSKVVEMNSLLNKGDIGESGLYFYFYILRELYKNLIHELDSIDDRLEDIEELIFNGEESSMVERISHVNRDLLNIRQAIRPHKTILESMRTSNIPFFDEDHKIHINALIGEYFRIYNILEGHKETLVDLRETNDSLLSTKTNEIMKTLTVMAFVILPPGLFAGLFGMNTIVTPIVGHPLDFWIILSIMAISTLLSFVVFKFKKWI